MTLASNPNEHEEAAPRPYHTTPHNSIAHHTTPHHTTPHHTTPLHTTLGWTCQHLADRFWWLEGAVQVAEAHSAGEVHGYLTFHIHRQVGAACAMVSAALGTVAPRLG